VNLNWLELTPVSAGPISEAGHTLRNVGTNQSLSANGSGTVVTGGSAQSWQFDHVGAGQYSLASGGKYWTTFMGPLHLGEWYHTERFSFVDIGAGYFRIVHTGSGLCLQPSVDDAPELELEACGSETNQQWDLD
jgi:hypothetical protein